MENENSQNYRYKTVSSFPTQSFSNVRLSTSDYHGTSAFRCSDVEMNLLKNRIKGRSKSEDDLMERGATKSVLKAPKSASYHKLFDEKPHEATFQAENKRNNYSGSLNF